MPSLSPRGKKLRKRNGGLVKISVSMDAQQSKSKSENPKLPRLKENKNLRSIINVVKKQVQTQTEGYLFNTQKNETLTSGQSSVNNKLTFTDYWRQTNDSVYNMTFNRHTESVT